MKKPVMQISVIGQGYVGLPVAIAAAESGFSVLGIDNDERKVSFLNNKKSAIEDLSDKIVSDQVNNSHYKATCDYSEIANSDIIIVCVPTPLDGSNKPDLSILESATKSVAKYMKKGALVILESTVAPGTTRNFFAPILKQGSGFKDNEFGVAFSPERIDPKSEKYSIKNTPKIVSGLTSESKKAASHFYSKFVDEVVECESLEIAETSKLLENSFRLINISFINELAMFCQKLDININSVIRAAATKPFGYMPFQPSLGIGGHCIPVDPIYLADKANEIGVPTKMIELATQINRSLPEYFANLAEVKLNGLKEKKIVVIGVAYKPNVTDVRETPAAPLIKALIAKGAQVSWHDDLVKEWNGEESVALSNQYDLAVLATPHDYLDLTKLGDVPILNTRGSI
jgi:UDP-N-acetyl-D-glucosamine dehydrogenase